MRVELVEAKTDFFLFSFIFLYSLMDIELIGGILKINYKRKIVQFQQTFSLMYAISMESLELNSVCVCISIKRISYEALLKMEIQFH